MNVVYGILAVCCFIASLVALFHPDWSASMYFLIFGMYWFFKAVR